MARTKQAARKTTEGRAPRRPFHQRSTTVEDVWAITEIAENILACLPMKDLLLAQRVSTGWRELIRSSPVLQERLFMRARQAGPAASQETLSDGLLPTRELNPLLVQHMPMWFNTSEDVWQQSVKDAPWAQTVSRLVFMRRDASWRRMLLAQPPFTTFECVQQIHAMGGDSLSVGRLEQPDGVRMGLAYDRAVQAIHGTSGWFPNHFYALMDGRAAQDTQHSSVSGGPQAKERIFGGVGKVTLVSRTTRGCTRPDYDVSRRAQLEQRQFTSAGAKPDKIVLHKVVTRAHDRSWWTEDGYSRR